MGPLGAVKKTMIAWCVVFASVRLLAPVVKVTDGASSSVMLTV